MIKYKFTGKEGGPLTKETAVRWIKNYQEDNPRRVRAHFFGEEIIKKILNEPGCKGLRIYYATDDVGGHQLLLVGTDADGNNMWPEESAGKDANGGGGTVADHSFPCPPYCPNENP